MARTAQAPWFVGGRTIETRPRHYPEPGPGQLLLRVEANAICGTDREMYEHGSAVVPGHEAAGVVEVAGEGTTTPVGTRGAVYLMDYCGTCRSCLLGHTNQCLAKRADMGFTSDGGFGPFELVHESAFFPVPDELSAPHATLLLDVMGTSRHALRRLALVREDVQSLYVAGAGPIGLGVIAMARIVLGDDVPVYVSDLSPWRRSFATELGAVALDASAAGGLAPALGVDAAIDSTGNEDARRRALELTGKRGVLVCVGHGSGLRLSVSEDLIAPERAVLGSEYFRFDEMAENLRLLEQHLPLLARIVTHTMPVSRIAEAFELFLAGRTGKVVVVQEA